MKKALRVFVFFPICILALRLAAGSAADYRSNLFYILMVPFYISLLVWLVLLAKLIISYLDKYNKKT